MDVTQSRRFKLRKIINYFLKHNDYSFIEGLTKLDDIGSGYDLELHSPDSDYQTFLSNEYIDKMSIQEIIFGLELNIRSNME